MIDEKKLIEDLEEQYKSLTPENYTAYCMIYQIKQDIEIIEAQPLVSAWIPCSKMLPDDGICVLVTVNGQHDNITFVDALQIGSFSRDEGWIIDGFSDWTTPDVTAWMPLPEPYKGAEHET